MPLTVSPPAADEYADFHQGYMSAMAGEPDALAVLERQQASIAALRRLTPDQSAHRYAAGKWSVKEIAGHLADSERVFTYRLLRIARGDETPLAGFDQDRYVPASGADTRSIADLADELAAVRAATLPLVRSLDDAALVRRGAVSDWTLSARALVFITAGHFAHHVKVLGDRYGISL